MKDYNGVENAATKDYDMSIHQNPDGLAWAQFFMKTIEENPDIVIDEDLMLGWFCNSMMAMHDHIHNIELLNGDQLQSIIDDENRSK